MDSPLDPRLLEGNNQPVPSQYAYPPESAAAVAPSPYALNPSAKHEEAAQAHNNAHLSLQHAPPATPYYNQQDGRQLNQAPVMDPNLHMPSGLSPVGGFGGEQDTPKRPRACEACRGLKVRCDFDGDLAETCKRCQKANRECVVTAPNRRRPKKTDTRIADLEQRINDLTASLEHQKRQAAGGKRLASENGFEDNNAFYNGQMPDFGAEPVRKKQKSSFGNDSANGFAHHALPIFPLDQALNGSEYADVIDRGILSNDDAVKVFEHYRNHMAKHLPAVVFDSSTNAGTLRKSKPILFLAILSIASGQDFPETQPVLTREAKKVLADHVMCKSEKSLELIQALHVLSIWHMSEDQEDTVAYQFIQQASTMAVAMGLGGPPSSGAVGVSFVNGAHVLALDDSSTVEKRRVWVSCYILSGSSSLPLRQANLIRWSPFLESTLQLLDSSTDAADKLIGDWARLQHLIDQASAIARESSDSPQTEQRNAMNAILSQVEEFASGVDVSRSYSLKLSANGIVAYCRMISTKIEETIDANVTAQIAGQDRKKPEEQSKILTESYSNAIKACTKSNQDVMDDFITYLENASHTDFNSLPGFHFARIAYSMFAMICMSFGASTPESKIRQAINAKDLRVDYYLPRLLELLRSSAADDIRRPVQRFQLVMKMLKAWYERSKDGRTSPIRNEIAELLDFQTQPGDEDEYKRLSVHGTTAGKAAAKKNTPLDLLSEVATKAPSAAQQDWYNNNNAYQPYQPYSSGTTQAETGHTTGFAVDPALEQAMSMAFGSAGNMFGTSVDDILGPFVQEQYGQSAQVGGPFS